MATLFIFFTIFHGSVLAKSQPLPLVDTIDSINHVKNYNLNVPEVLVSDFKNAFFRNFQLHRRDPTYHAIQIPNTAERDATNSITVERTNTKLTIPHSISIPFKSSFILFL